MVTPNHDLYTARRRGERYSKLKVSQLNTQRAIFSAPAALEQQGWDFTGLSGTVYSSVCFGQVLGLYLGDGCATRSIRLGAKNPRKIAKFELALKALSEEYGGQVKSYTGLNGATSVELLNPELSAWLTLYAGANAHTKRIPEMAYGMDEAGRRALLDGLLSTDGQKSKRGEGWSYNTVSRQLAGGVQRLALSLGWRAAISEDEIDSGPYYRVRLCHRRETYIQKPEVVQYQGMVYCVEVENHLVITRRNGRPIVTGNSMFESYIEKSDKKVQRSFRLAEIFLGTVKDLSFATAFASYTVAEAQVFAPERAEFDEKINLLIMPMLKNGEDFEFKSMPISVSDANLQLKAMELVMEHSEKESFFETLQQVTDLPTLVPNEEPFVPKSAQLALAAEAETARHELDRSAKAEASVQPGKPKATPTPAPTPNENGPPKKTSSNAKKTVILADEDSITIHELAQQAVGMTQKGLSEPGVAQDWEALMGVVKNMPEKQQSVFRAMMAMETFPEFQHDPAGAAELASAAQAVAARGHAE